MCFLHHHDLRTIHSYRKNIAIRRQQVPLVAKVGQQVIGVLPVGEAQPVPLQGRKQIGIDHAGVAAREDLDFGGRIGADQEF